MTLKELVKVIGQVPYMLNMIDLNFNIKMWLLVCNKDTLQKKAKKSSDISKIKYKSTKKAVGTHTPVTLVSPSGICSTSSKFAISQKRCIYSGTSRAVTKDIWLKIASQVQKLSP